MKNLILDGNNIIFKAYFTIKNNHVSNGIKTPVVEQFFKICKRYVERFDPKEIYITWDKRINDKSKNFRYDLVPYKENRNVEESVEDAIHKCVDLIIEMSNSMGIKTILPWNMEADDVVAYLCEVLEGGNIVVSSDKDFLQLVDDNTHVFNTTKYVLVTPENFEEFAGVPKEAFVDYKAIMGDKSDNISGVHLYGPVKSRKLAMSKDWSTLTKEEMEVVERNRKLMDLTESYKHSDGEIESYTTQLEQAAELKFNEPVYREWCQTYGMGKLLTDIESWRNVQSKNTLEEWFSFV